MPSKIIGLKELTRDLKGLAKVASGAADKGLFKAGTLVTEAAKDEKYWTKVGVRKKKVKGKAVPAPKKPKPTMRTGNAMKMIGPPKKVARGRVEVPSRARYSKFLEDGGFLFMTPALEDNADKIEELVGVKVFTSVKADGWKVD